MPCRLFRKAVQQGRSERRGESYSGPYVEPLSDVRTPLAAFVNSLLSSIQQTAWSIPLSRGAFSKTGKTPVASPSTYLRTWMMGPRIHGIY
jgi:hypothetical protein